MKKSNSEINWQSMESLEARLMLSGTSPTISFVGAPYNINEGDSAVLDASATTDPDMDAMTFNWDLNNDGTYEQADAGNNPTFNWATLQAAGIDDDGSYTIGLEVFDGSNTVTDTVTLTVSNTAPTATLTGNANVDEETSYTLNVALSDPGDDTASLIVVNWGDGSNPEVVSAGDNTHIYADEGSYTINVSVMDEDGYHTNIESKALTVDNAAPSIVNGATVSLAAVNEDIAGASNAGQDINSLFLSHYSDDADDFAGVAIIANTANAATEGSWEYSTDSGTSWTAIGTGIDQTTAIVLGPSHLLRFQPVANFAGTPGTLDARLWDGGGAATAGQANDITGELGGSGGYAGSAITTGITVNAQADAPTFSSAAEENATEDTLYTYNITATDADTGDTLTITALAKPTWLTFTDNGDGTATLTGTPTNDEVGAHSISLQVADGDGNLGTQAFTLTVANANDAPTLENAIADQTATEDAAFSFQVPADTFDDIDTGDTLTYSATQADDSALPAWLTFTAGTRTFSGTPANGDVGTLSVKVTADDGNGGTISDTFDITISNVNDAPTVANPIADQTATEDVAFSYQFPVDAFEDVDSGDSLTYSATLADDSALPGWLTFTAGTRTFSGTPLNANVGTIAVKVTATDGSSATVTDTFNITINNANDAPTLDNPIADESATEDVAYTFTFDANVFSDVDVSDTLTYTATQADDSALPAWLSFNAGTRTFSGTPLNDDVGTLSIKVTASDGTATVSDTFDIVIAAVNDAAVITVPAAQTMTEDTTLTFSSGNSNAVSISDDSGSNDVSITLTVTQGTLDVTLDGTATITAGADQSATMTISGTVTEINNTLEGMIYTPSANYDGSDTLTVEVNDGGNTGSGGAQTSSDTVTINVTAVDDAPALDLDSDDSGGNSPDFATAYTENAVAVAILDADATVADVDTTNLASIIITITNFATDDVLAADISGTSVSKSYNTSTGVMTLSGADSVANYQQVLRTLTYVNNGDNPGTSKTITFVANDGSSNSATVTTTITITTDDDAPSGITNTGITLNEAATATITTSELTVADADTANSAITFTVVTKPTNGTLYNDGVALNDTDTFTLADIAASLITYTHNGGETTTDSLVFTYEDATNGASGNQTFTFTVNAVNDAPVLSLDGDNSGGSSPDATGAYTENAGATDIVDDATISDAESDNLVSMTISITDFQSGDTLDITEGTLTKNYNAGTGVLTLTGSEVAANYQTALRTLTYTTASNDPGASRTITVVVNDGTDNSNTATLTLNITTDNDAPTENANTGASVNEDESHTITATELDYNDPDNTDAQIVYTITTAPTHGTVYLDGVALGLNGTFTQADIGNSLVTYTNTDGTSDSFVFTVSDGNTDITNQTFTLTVSAVNDVPVLATNAGRTVAEGGTEIIRQADLETTDGDNPATSTLVYTVTSLPTNGDLKLNGTTLNVNETFTQADINASNVTYVHDGGETTSDSFIFNVKDASNAGVTGATFAITVTPVNDTPVLTKNLALTVNEGGSGTITAGKLLVLDNDVASDAEIVFTIGTAPANGTLSLDGSGLTDGGTFTQDDIYNGLVSYTHDGGETSSDSFTFTVSDSAGGTIALQTFSLTVTAQNDDPTVSVNSVTVTDTVAITDISEDDTITFSAANSNLIAVADTDAAAGDLTVALSVTNGTLNISDGSGVTIDSGADESAAMTITGTIAEINTALDGMIYTPASHGSETITIVMNDGGNTGAGGGGDVTRTLTFSINNNPEIDTNAGITLDEGATAYISPTELAVTDTDNTSAQLTFTIETAPVNGTLYLDGVALGATGTFTQDDLINSGNDSLLTYVHGGGENTTDSFVFSVADTSGGTIGNTTFNITITPVNDAPVLATNDGATFDEGSAGNQITAAKLNVTDAEAGVVTYTLTTAPTNGTLYIDGNELTTDGAYTTFTQAQIDGGLLTYTHDGSETTSDSFVFDVEDDASSSITGTTFAITITPVNDTPTLSVNNGQTFTEDISSPIESSNLSYSDNDGDTLTYTITTAPSNGSLYIAGNGTPLGIGSTFTQANINSGDISYVNSNGSNDSFEFTVGDGTVTLAAATFNMTVDAANDLPTIATNAGLTLDEAATGYIATAQLETTDPEQAAAQITYTLQSNPVNGTLYLNGNPLNADSLDSADYTFTQADINNAPNSLLTYVHDGSETTTDSFTFDVRDGVGGNITGQTFTITITPVSDAPTLTANTGLAVTEDSSALISTTELQYEDIEGDTLTYTVTSVPADGTLYRDGVALNNNDTFTQADIGAGLITYTNADGANSSFNFTVGDGTTTLAEATFNFTTTAVNDAPTIATNTGDTLNEAATVTIGQAKLEASDDDNAATELTYTITTAPANGTLYRDGVALNDTDNATFTQDDINNNLITYVHSGGENTTDSFVFDVADTASGSVTGTTFSLTITPVNDDPTMAANTGVTVDEASTGTVVTTVMLQIADAEESTAANLTYTLDVAPTRGTLRLSGVALNATGTFTQADVDGGLVTYDHDGSEESSDSFDFTADDGSGGSVTGTFTITVTPVNEDPTISFDGGAIGTPENIAAIDEEGTITFSAANNFLVTVADVDAASEDLSVTIAVTKGTITLNAAGTGALANLSGDGTATVSFDGTIAEINAAIDSMVYTAVAPNTGSETITITVNDNGNTGAVSGNDVVGEITFTINDAKSAPILDNSVSMTLTAVDEDTAAGSITGDTVAAILATGAGGDPINLPDGTGSGEIKGIAVIAVDDTNGTWQYSTDTGSTWTAFGAVANNSAVLLSPDANNLIRFVPDADYFGAPEISFRAWDSVLVGASGDTAVDASTNGGTTSFSAAVGTVSVTVNDVNDAPVLDAGTEMSLTAITEDIADGDNTGTLVSDILATGTGGDPITDIDDNPVEGIAIIDIEETDGTWQYSLDGGSNWINFVDIGYLDATLITATANDLIRFVPGANWSGSASISFVAWDTTDGRSAGDTGVSIAAAGIGGTNPYSLVAAFANIATAAANDAPVLDNSGDPTVTGIDEDVADGSNTGMTVAALLATGAGGDPITDIDSGAVDGIAVTAVDDTNGEWQYSIDGGSTWTAFGAVASNSAVTLGVAANDMVRFVPDAHYYGDATITFRAWDTTDGSATGDTAVDTSINGGTAAFSNDTETATITVASVEDAPVLDNAIADQTTDEDAAFSFAVPGNTFSDADPTDTLTYTASLADDSALPAWLSFDAGTQTFSGTPENGDVGSINVKIVANDGDQTISDTFQITVNNTNDAPVLDTTAMTVTAVAEDIASGANTGMLVSDLLATGAGADPISDADAVAVNGIAVTAVDDTNGTWEYSTDGGSTWTAFGAVSDSAAVLLTVTANDMIRFQPDADFDSDATITFRAWDTTDGSATGDTAVDVSTNGGTTAFSTDAAVATISVTPVNDNPTLDNAIADQAATDDVAFSFVVPANTFGDVDTLDTLTYTATLADDSALPAWLSFDAGTQTFSGTPADGDVGTISVKVTADDGNATVSDTFDLVVSDANDAPTLDNAIADQAATEDAEFTFVVPADTFGDVDAGDSFTYTASLADDSALPAWLSFDAGTRTFSGTPANGDVGSIDVKVTATDTGSAAISDTFTITIANTNDAPTVANAIADQAATEDAEFTFVVPADTFDDVDAGDSLTYSATLADDSALPAWLSFDAGTRTFSGTPTNDEVGTVDVKVTATDGSDASVSDTFTITIANTNDAPVVEDQALDMAEDASVDDVLGTLAATDVDASDTLIWSISGGADAAMFNIDSATGAVSVADVTGVDFETTTSYSFEVTVEDAAGATDTATITINVTNVNEAPTLTGDTATIPANTPDAEVIATVTVDDVDAGDTFTYTITAGNDAGAYGVNGSGGIIVADNTALVGNTIDTLTVQVEDAGGLTATATVTVTVTNVDLLPAITAVNANASLIAGNDVEVRVGMTNNGQARATELATVTIYAVPDGGGDNVELYSSTVSTGISVGGTKNYVFDLTIPDEATMPVGDYTLLMTVQYGEVVSQVTDDTVLSVDPINIVVDPTIVSHTLNAGVLPEDTGTVQVLLTNNGNDEATETATINIYVSSDQAFDDGTDASVVAISYTISTNLDPGESKTVNIPVTIPEIAALSDGAGDYYLVVTCDHDGDQTESASDDTIRIDEPFEDLTATVKSSSFADQVVPGDKGVVYVTVSNIGNVTAAGNVEVRLYASSDGNVAGATELGTAVISAVNLDPDEIKNFKFVVVMPTMDTDDYNLVAEVTVVDGMNEDPADEANNAGVSVDSFAFDLMFGTFGDRTNVPMTITDPASGELVNFKLTGGGYGTLVYDDAAAAYDITFTGTTIKSTIKINALTKYATVDINDMSFPADGETVSDISKLVAKDVNLTGDLDLSGTFKVIYFNNVNAATEQTMNLGGGYKYGKIYLGEVADLSITSATPISLLSVDSWADDETVTADVVEADWIGKIDSDGVFDAGLTLDVDTRGRSLVSAAIDGQVTDAVWDLAGIISKVTIGGDVEGLDIAALSLTKATLKGDLTTSTIDLTQPLGTRTKAISKITVTGSMTGSTITTLDNIGKIYLGAMVGSNIFAGVNPGVTELPDVGDFIAANGDGIQATISTFVIKPLAPAKSGGFGAAGRFSDSNLAAGTIKKAILSDVEFDNTGTAFGVAADNVIKKALVYSGKTKIGYFRYDDWYTDLSVDADDFEIRIV